MSELLARIVATLGELSAAAAVTIVAAAILDLALRRVPWPELRAVPWLLVLARFLLPPDFASPLALCAGIGSGLESAIGTRGFAGGDAGAIAILDTVLRDGALVSLWFAGALLLALGAASRHRRTRSRLLARALPELPAEWREAALSARERLGLRRLPRIAVIPGISGAMVLGALRPVVLLPTQLPAILSADPHAADAARREHVLLHELAHVKRRDPLLGALSAALQVIFWFHPLLWWARRRLALVVELCADAEVARALGSAAPEYRRTLLSAAGHASGVLPAGALGFLSRQSAILERLRALERPRGGPRVIRRLAATLLAIAFGATVLPLHGSVLRGERSPSSPSGDDLVARSELDAVPRFAPDLPGCLLDRYTVLGALAAAEGPPAAPPTRNASIPTD